jgi:hypothetical protein
MKNVLSFSFCAFFIKSEIFFEVQKIKEKIDDNAKNTLI